MAAAEGVPTASGLPVRHARRSPLAWLRALPPLARPITQTMPWVPLIIGCLAGTGYLALIAHVADTAHWLLGQGYVREAFIPAVAGLAFAVRAPFRPLTQVSPVPAWIAPAGHLLLAAPILAATCWAQLGIAAHSIATLTRGHPPTVYPLIAQLTGWCAVTVAAAACVDRSRYADLSGATAVPVSAAAIALAWYLPITHKLLAEPPATAHAVTIAWYAVAAAALALACVAMRDQWHRYTRWLHRIAVPGAPRPTLLRVTATGLHSLHGQYRDTGVRAGGHAQADVHGAGLAGREDPKLADRHGVARR